MLFRSIMEVILSSVSARSHFYGKLAGILLVALTQIVVYAVSIGLGFYWLKNNSTVQAFLAEFSIRDILGEFLAYTLLYVSIKIGLYHRISALPASTPLGAYSTKFALLRFSIVSEGADYLASLLIGIPFQG